MNGEGKDTPWTADTLGTRADAVEQARALAEELTWDALRALVQSRPELVQVLAHLGRLEVKVGDCIVLSPPESLSPEVQGYASATCRKLFPGARLLILEPGMRLGVLAQPETER